MMHLVLAATLALASPVPLPANEAHVTFAAKDGNVLAGTISWPAGSDAPSPAFVLIGESGATERDGTAGSTGTLAQIAAALNDSGFAVLRYDERGVARPGLDDDAVAAVAALQKNAHADPARIDLLGLGEGGMVAMDAALQGAPIRGIAMLAPLPIANTGDPRVEVAKVNVPMLLLLGGNDTRVTAEDVKGFVAAAHDARRSLRYGELDGDNHLFQVLPPPGDSALPVEGAALDPRVVAAIIAWLVETQ